MKHTLKSILAQVSKITGISEKDIKGKEQYYIFAKARCLFCIYANKLTHHTQRSITEYINRYASNFSHYNKFHERNMEYEEYKEWVKKMDTCTNNK